MEGHLNSIAEVFIMARAAGDLTVAELERLLDSKKSRLGTLTKKRDKLQKELVQVEKQIAELRGRTVATIGSKARNKPAKRPDNVKPLSAFVIDILSKNKKGLTLKGLSEEVLASGYKTNSTNFRNVLYQCLYNSKRVRHDDQSQTYKLV